MDIPLNANGLSQARLAAERLRGRGIAAIVASPLSRARITAEIVAAALGLPVETEDDLHEASYGERERQPMTEWFDAWVAGTHTPQGGESFAELRARAVRALNRALTRPAPVLVVAHGGLFRAVRAEMGLEPNLRTPNAVPFFCTPPGPGERNWTLIPATAESGGSREP